MSLASSWCCWEFPRLQGLSRCWCLSSPCLVALGCPSSSLGAEGGIRGCHPHHPLPEPLPAPLPGPCRQGRDGLAAFTTLLSSRPKMAGGPRACRGEAQRPKFRWVSTSRWCGPCRGCEALGAAGGQGRSCPHPARSAGLLQDAQSSAQSWILEQFGFIILGGKTQGLEEITREPQEK